MLPCFDVADVQNVTADARVVSNGDDCAVAGAEFAGVADLAAHLGVEVGLVEHDRDCLVRRPRRRRVWSSRPAPFQIALTVAPIGSR